MKTCRICGKSKALECFTWGNKEHTYRDSRCKPCRTKKTLEQYHSNSKYRKKFDERRAERRKINSEYILAYLREHPCVDCGFSDIRALQFDHVVPVSLGGGSKQRVSGMVTHSLESLVAEISRCEVRCANCHMIRTQQQFGWERK